ncbi:hypothetical protein K0B96_04765 [Horticoccus luteus]|uniref:TLP18.3/Psb32/MOLO-1 phosphatase superfamily protein n=1 Tax=Horticoccus luteus TaxID=2862869 RepID=A0A8F9TVB9_9BACT|nr:hypothetical protein [Horticoccus luteus]QYM79934.1 hypothetical protein K0B96_04765 [Horticoccus luteus]
MKTFLRSAFVALGVLSVAVFASATPLTQDLGGGLTYYRAHHLPADLPPSELKAGAVVLDLRNVTGDRDAATALAAWLDFRGNAKRAVFVLLNTQTSSSLRQAATAAPGRPGVLTLESASRHATADITVAISPTEDRRAYDALENGTAIADLIAAEPHKERHDEAALARDRLAPAQAEADEDADVGGDEASAAPAAPPAPPPAAPVDAVLQRAVQLHRALVALKKI